MMNILAFAATNSRQSINSQLVNYAANVLEERSNIEINLSVIDLNDYEMPIYSTDRENESGIPAQAQRFFHQIQEADIVLISFAEHNGSFTAAYKNIYDWASRIDMKVYQDKAMVLLATSPGPGGASSVLKSAVESFPYFGADVLGSYSLGMFYDKFDMENAQLQQDELERLISELDKVIPEVVEA